MLVHSSLQVGGLHILRSELRPPHPSTKSSNPRRRLKALLAHPAAVGIDLGTTSSAVAVIFDGKPQIVEDEGGKAVIPSIVSFLSDGSTLVGHAALGTSQLNPANTFYSVKRLLGRQYAEVQHTAAKLSYKVLQGADGMILLDCPNQSSSIRPEEVASHILRHLVTRAERALGSTVSEAVVTIPAYYSPAQRQATLAAARMAGLKRVLLLQEPVAAAMAYGFGKPTDAETLLVFDLGGGTFDISILESFEGIMEVLSTAGDAQLGGDDFTRTLMEVLVGQLPAAAQQLLRSGRASPAARMAFFNAAEQAKQLLSTESNITIATKPILQLLSADASNPQGLTPKVTYDSDTPCSIHLDRDSLQQACVPLLQQLWPPLQAVAVDTRLQYDGRPCLPQQDVPSSSKSVAAGAGAGVSEALHAQSSLQALNVFREQAGSSSSSSSGKYTAPPRKLTGVLLVGAATRMPCVREFLKQITNCEPAAGVNPEEVVALGAAIQAGVMQGSTSGLELMDGSYVSGLHSRASGFQT